MSLERKDIRAKLHPDIHAALIVLCEVDQLEIAEFIERELVRVVEARVHAATLIAARTARLGISGIARERQSTPTTPGGADAYARP